MFGESNLTNTSFTYNKKHAITKVTKHDYKMQLWQLKPTSWNSRMPAMTVDVCQGNYLVWSPNLYTFVHFQGQELQLISMELLSMRPLFSWTGADQLIPMVSFWDIRCSIMATGVTP